MTGILEARGLTRQFGGLRAVDSADITVKKNTLHGLIGPNGAGKTTLVNMLTGVDRIDAGTVIFDGTDVTTYRSYRMAKLGMARTFQTSQLFEEENVLSNVMAGRHRHIAYGFPHTFFYTPKTRRIETANRIHCLGILEQLGLADDANRLVGQLPYGRRRLVELARAVASEPSLLVLDEPAAGLPGSDVEALGTALVALSGTGHTVLIIEHNLTLLMSICHSLTVLSEGRVIADGDPAAVRNDAAVIEAYIGKSDDA